MIELKIVNTNTKIYIILAGIPEELEIIEIKHLIQIWLHQKKTEKIEKDERDDLFDDDYLDEWEELLFNYDEELKVEENLEMLDAALNIIDDVEIQMLKQKLQLK